MSDTIDSIILSDLYVTCHNGNVDSAQQILSKLSLDEVNQTELNGNTSLHAACQSNHSKIVKLLLDRGALRTIKNNDGQIPFDMATTDEMKQLFHRSQDEAQARFSTNSLPNRSIEWVSIEYGQFGWKSKSLIQNRNIQKAMNVIEDEDQLQISLTNKAQYLFNKARAYDNPEWIIRAYSCEISFCQFLNNTLALEPVPIVLNAMEDCFKYDYTIPKENISKENIMIL